MYIFSYDHLSDTKDLNDDILGITARYDKINDTECYFCYDENNEIIAIILDDAKQIIFKDKDQHLMIQIKYGG